MRNEMLQESREGFSASATLVRESANSERSKHHLPLPRTLATDMLLSGVPRRGYHGLEYPQSHPDSGCLSSSTSERLTWRSGQFVRSVGLFKASAGSGDEARQGFSKGFLPSAQKQLRFSGH